MDTKKTPRVILLNRIYLYGICIDVRKAPNILVHIGLEFGAVFVNEKTDINISE